MLSKITKYFELSSYIAIILGVGIAWYEYNNQVKRNSIQQSFQYINRFQEGDIFFARRAILQPWLQYNLNKLSKSKIDKDVINQLVSKIVEKNKNIDLRLDMKSNIILITEFLDGTAHCVSNKICHQQTINSLMGHYAKTFYCLYKPVIINTREFNQLPQLGRGLENLALINGGCSN